MAEVVEHELMENVCNLKSYIKDTTELLGGLFYEFWDWLVPFLAVNLSV
jgi:hypothetical protein